MGENRTCLDVCYSAGKYQVSVSGNERNLIENPKTSILGMHEGKWVAVSYEQTEIGSQYKLLELHRVINCVLHWDRLICMIAFLYACIINGRYTL